jgi:hypothetical protein
MHHAQDHHSRFTSKYDQVLIDAIKPKLRLTHIFSAMPYPRQLNKLFKRCEDARLNTSRNTHTCLAFQILTQSVEVQKGMRCDPEVIHVDA